MTSAEDDFDPFAGGELSHTVPVTPEQEEIWLSIQLGGDPASLAYNQPIAFELRGDLDEGALGRALQRLILRHEALRTTLAPDGATLCVAASVVVPLVKEARPAGSAAERAAAIEAAYHRAVAEPFDLVRGPLVRTHLVGLGPRDHVLVFVSHHLVCDGWSLGVVARELGLLYSAERGAPGGQASLEPAAAFSAYAADRSSASRRAAEETSRAYWLEQLRDLPPPLDLPLDHARPPERTFAADRVDYTLDAALVRDLKAMGAARGASLVAVLLAGFEAFLHRLTGQRSMAIALPVAGQAVTDRHALVGHCVRALPVRADVDPDAPFEAHLASVRRALLGAIEHPEISYGGLVKDLHVPRDPSRVPLAPVMFNVDQDPTVPALAGLEVIVQSPARTHENFEILVNARLWEGQVVLETMFKTDLFDRSTIEARLAEYRTLLASAVADPSKAIGDLEVMPEDEKRRALVDVNRTGAPVPEATVCALFRASVARVPERTAVTSGGRSLTYRELDAASGALAAELRAAGVGEGAFVGISLSRGVDLLVGLLAILRTGAAYVPLDPEYPKERLAFIAKDAGLGAFVTERALGASLPAGERAKRFFVDTPREGGAADLDASKPASAAYVIYTSGSTGTPKGVVVEHRNVTNFLTTMAHEPGLGESDVLVAITTPSFDISVLELFLPLTVGAKVVIATRDQVTQGDALAALLVASRATVMQATPSSWRLLLEAGWAGDTKLKALTGGEALSADLAASLLGRTASLWNCYGPTETTVWSMLERVAPGPITIGRPIANTTVYVLDARMRPVVPGATGELYIGGLGVTRGYWQRPDLTRERFVPDPFGGDRLYKTGDLARQRRDGRLEWLGRSDFQVKVRGHRIELPEIEASLCALPGVTEAVAIVREDRPGDQRIVAYVRAATGASLVEDALREELRARLPAYMIPQHVVTLAAFPQTANGKIDRKALPKPEVDHTPQKLPETEVEKALAGEIERLLGVPQVGLDGDFFALGGHSLLAQRLTVRVRAVWGIEMPMRIVFTQPTVKGLADFIAAALGVRHSSPLLEPTGDTEEFVL